MPARVNTKYYYLISPRSFERPEGKNQDYAVHVKRIRSEWRGGVKLNSYRIFEKSTFMYYQAKKNSNTYRKMCADFIMMGHPCKPKDQPPMLQFMRRKTSPLKSTCHSRYQYGNGVWKVRRHTTAQTKGKTNKTVFIAVVHRTNGTEHHRAGQVRPGHDTDHLTTKQCPDRLHRVRSFQG